MSTARVPSLLRCLAHTNTVLCSRLLVSLSVLKHPQIEPESDLRCKLYRSFLSQRSFGSPLKQMFDIQLRSLKDKIFDPCCQLVPPSIRPLQVTAAAFIAGFLSCYSASHNRILLSIGFWFLNRTLDCLDGALARYRKSASDLGGYFDLLGDFVIYSLIPIAIATGENASSNRWAAVASLEATFHVNNFILFYVAAVLEKKQSIKDTNTNELTSVMMRPAVIEGAESGLLFTAMLAFPNALEGLCWMMAGLVTIGIIQRTIWVTAALR